MTEPVSVEAVRQRAERAHDWVDRHLEACPECEECETPWRTFPVAMHFERDMPALLDELARLRTAVRLAEVAADKWHDLWQTEADRLRPLRDAAVAWVGAKRAIAQAATGEGERLLAALDTAEDALEQATLAALEGQPDQSEGRPTG